MDFRDYDTRLAAYAVLVDNRDRVLLALWNEGEQPTWTLPGGGVEFAETVEAAAIRELKEETGYDVELGDLLGVDAWWSSGEERLDGAGRPLKSVRVVFEGRVVGGDLADEVDGTTDEARWIPLAEVSDLRRVPLIDAALGFWRDGRR